MDRQIVLESNNSKVIISTLGAQLISFKVNDVENIWHGDTKFWAGHAPILWPAVGGLIDGNYYYDGVAYPMKKHGFIRFEEFEVINQTTNSVTLINRETTETFKSFPFKYEFVVCYELNGNELKASFKAVNKDNKNMFMNIGSHEGYELHDDIKTYSVKFPDDNIIESNEIVGNLISHTKTTYSLQGNKLPLNYNYFKIDALVFNNIKSKSAILMHNNEEVLEINFPNAKAVVLWSIKDAGFICIEPWNAVHDYIDSEKDISKKDDVVMLKAGESYEFTHSIKVR